MEIQRDRNEYNLSFQLDWRGGAHVTLAPELPAGSHLRSASLDGKTVIGEENQLPASTKVQLKLKECSGQHTLRLEHHASVDWLPVDEPLVRGITSRNLRVIHARWDNSCWTLRVEGLPGRDYPVDFFTDRTLASTTPKQRAKKQTTGWRVIFSAPANAPTNAAGFAAWEVKIPFGSK